MRDRKEIEEAIKKYEEIRVKQVKKNNIAKIEIIDQRVIALNWVLDSD